MSNSQLVVTPAAKSSGSAFAVVILVLTIMLLLVTGLNQDILGQQRSTTNYLDYELAQNYAHLAMLNAESTVNSYDQLAALETSTGTIDINNTWGKLRYTKGINSSTSNIVANGVTCNYKGTYKGFCYNSNDNYNFNSSQSWQPWTLTNSLATKPCNSYTQGSGDVLMLDDANSSFSVSYDTGDPILCAQPRYLIEPINLAWRGKYKLVTVASSTYESYGLQQANSALISTYRALVGSSSVINNPARLYRITVRAFGRNGDTRVTLQEYVAIVGNTQNRVAVDSVNTSPHQILIISSRWLH